MGMPFAEVVEAGVVRPGAIKERRKRLGMKLRRPHKVGFRAGYFIQGKFSNSERSGLNLLRHNYAAHFFTAGAAQPSLKLAADFRWQYYQHLVVSSVQELALQ